MGAGLLVGSCLFFHFDKCVFYTFYSMHFFMDLICCQEEMNAVKYIKKGTKDIERSYFLLYYFICVYE